VQLNPYLNFDGNCAAAFRFYERSLGGRIEAMLTHGESPIAGQVPSEWHARIMHARLVVGDQVLMGSDVPPGQYEPPRGFAVSLVVDDPAEAERAFAALAEGGTVRMAMQETFWALRFGMLVDRFGVPWMVNCMRPA
jgi:PhnB protein